MTKSFVLRQRGTTIKIVPSINFLLHCLQIVAPVARKARVTVGAPEETPASQ